MGCNIKRLLKERLLDEIMMNSTHLPKETALFSKPNTIYLSLYDPMTRNTYGMFSGDFQGQNYDVTSVAAEKGFGPYMYELAMMTAGVKGKGLMPARDGDIRDGAFRVWTKMFDRSDIKKQAIAPFDSNGNWNPEYSVALWTGDEDEFENPEEFAEFLDELDDSVKKSLTIYNTVYSMAPSQNYRDMLARGDAYVKKGMNPERAFSAAQNLFMQKYD